MNEIMLLLQLNTLNTTQINPQETLIYPVTLQPIQTVEHC